MTEDTGDLVQMDRDRLSIDDFEQVLGDDATTIDVVHDGNTFLSPSADKVIVSRPRARQSARGYTKLTFKVSFVIGDDDFDEDERETMDRKEMVATSPNWGLEADD